MNCFGIPLGRIYFLSPVFPPLLHLRFCWHDLFICKLPHGPCQITWADAVSDIYDRWYDGQAHLTIYHLAIGGLRKKAYEKSSRNAGTLLERFWTKSIPPSTAVSKIREQVSEEDENSIMGPLVNVALGLLFAPYANLGEKRRLGIN